MIFLYLLLSALMLVGIYECRKGLKGKDYRAAKVWAVIALAMVGLMTYAAVVPSMEFWQVK